MKPPRFEDDPIRTWLKKAQEKAVPNTLAAQSVELVEVMLNGLEDVEVCVNCPQCAGTIAETLFYCETVVGEIEEDEEEESAEWDI